MAKTTNLFIRLEPQLKEEAESVLNQLGIPMSNAVNMFLRQIVLQQGLPFDVKLPKPAGLSSLTEGQLHKELDKGYQEMLQGKVTPIDHPLAEDNEDYKP